MKTIIGKFTPLVLALGATSVSAQDAGNLLAAFNHATANVNTVSQSLLAGDAAGSINGLNRLGTDLTVDLSEGTPLEESVAGQTGAAEQLTQPFADAAPQLDPLIGQGLDAAAPVTTLVRSPGLLASMPLVHGENFIVFSEGDNLGGYLQTGGLPLTQLNELLLVDLLGPGDGDGGDVLIPAFGGSGSAGPELVALFADTGTQLLTGDLADTAFFAQDLFRVVDFVAANPFADGSLPVPLLGLVVGDASAIPLGDSLPLSGLQGDAQAGALSGLELAELPLPAGDLDPATLTALMGGATLPGL